MKKIFKTLLVIIAVAFVSSCADPALDPFQLDSVKKGTILALRGTQLENIYVNGTPGAEFFPRIINGEETFDFDGEILAEDPNTLASFDIYAIKRTKVGSITTTSRVLLENVPFSEFKTTEDYRNPWVSVSLNLTDILDAIGIDYTNPDDVDILLDVYKFGIGIEADLNLTDGSKVLASQIVASGLFQSNQFYPAQKLTYTVTDFCPYDAAQWSGVFSATEVYSDGAYGPYDVTFGPGATADSFVFTNFWDSGITAYVQFVPSLDDPNNVVVTFPDQDDGSGELITGTGTYNQCTGVFKIDTEYAGYTWRYEFVKI